MSGIEQAAAAFDVELGNSKAESGSRGANNNAPVEQMFGNIGDLEVDEESPAQGGGDDDGVETTSRKRQLPVQDEEQDDVELDADADAADGEDGEGDDQEGGPDEDDDEVDDVYKVQIDGEEVEVGLREALDGYIRQETFHRRLNQLNDVKVAMRTEAQKLLEDRKTYVSKIEDLEKHIALLVPKEPNWDEEYARDPKAARELQKRFEQFNQTIAALGQEKARVSQEQKDEDARNNAEYLDRENKRIMANNPTWKDEKVMQRDLSMMAATATRAGFALEEVQGITDSRMVTVLLKAAKWDKLQQDKPKPVRRGSKPVKQGSVPTRSVPRVNTAMKNLSKSGSIDDAAAVFGNLISPRRK